MQFKTKTLERQYLAIHPRLREIISWVDQQFIDLSGKDITVTCLNRTPKQNEYVDGNPHSFHMEKPCRAADIRRWGYSDEQLMVTRGEFYMKIAEDEHERFIIEKDHIHVQVADIQLSAVLANVPDEQDRPSIGVVEGCTLLRI